MVKIMKNMKMESDSAQLEPALRSLLGRIPFVEVRAMQREVPVSPMARNKADAVFQLSVGQRPWVLIVEEKRLGQPREARMAVLQLERALGQLAPDQPGYGVFVAPFISAESAKICIEAGMGYVDFSGNAQLLFDGVYIETRSAENPFREKREVRSLFTPKAERMLRVLLTPPLRAWKVGELATAAGVSFGQVSKVRKHLIDQEWAKADGEGLRLEKPAEVAEAWRKSYSARLNSRDGHYTLLHGEALDTATRAALAEAGAHAVLASYSAARWIAPYARQATQFFYADEIGAPILKRHLQLQPVPRGENVVLMQPREDDVFSGRIEAAPGIWCTGLVQTWLDLTVAGERGGEAADHLLSEKLLPAWKRVAR